MCNSAECLPPSFFSGALFERMRFHFKCPYATWLRDLLHNNPSNNSAKPALLWCHDTQKAWRAEWKISLCKQPFANANPSPSKTSSRGGRKISFNCLWLLKANRFAFLHKMIDVWKSWIHRNHHHSTARGLSAAMILRQLFQNDPWSAKKMKEAEEFSADRPLNEPGSKDIPGQRKSNWIRTKLGNELANYSAPASSEEWLTSFNVSPSSFSAPPEKHQSRALWRLLIIFFSHTTLDEILSWFSLELIFLTRRRKQ